MPALSAASPFPARRDLPPAAPLPATLQTLALRRWPVSFLERCGSRLGSRFTVLLVDMPPLVFLSDPHDIDALFAASPTALHPGVGTKLIAPLIGESSFILSDEEERKAVRGAVSPAFRRSHEHNYAEEISAIVKDEVASWPLEQTVALYPRLSQLTLRVVLNVLFGEDPEIRGLGRRLLEMLSVARSFVVQEPRLRHLPGWHATWKRFQRQRGEVDALLSAIITRYRSGHHEHGRVLEMLIRARKRGAPMPVQEIADNLLSLMVAGHETTASALAWAFQLLAHNPDVQHRLVEEIESGAGEDYLAATVLETLRHGPVFLFAIPRAVAGPIEIGGMTYRPPTQLLACTYLMHHDPDLYPEPEAFRPERFMDAAPPPLTWRPWGGGRRRCLGQHLATLEMRTVLREVLTSRDVLAAGRRIERARWRSAIVVPHAGARVILRARNPTRSHESSFPSRCAGPNVT
jgi:cytochrome P450